ncbi:MAG: NifB/NifX family molybdenum-iron cluster-binding protein [Microbacter sp.]
MKVAVTAINSSLKSLIDMHFGRAPFFVVFDKETKAVELLPNPFASLTEGAGIEAVKFLAEKGVSQIISGEIGNAIKGLIDAYRIQMIILKDETKTVEEILNMLSKSKLDSF